MMRSEQENSQNSANAVDSGKKRQKKILICAGCFIVALLFAVSAGLIGYAVGNKKLRDDEKSLLWMLDAVEQNYYKEVPREELFDRLYDALELDIFCSHSTPEEYAVVNDEMTGNNSGYGITFVGQSGAVRVRRVIHNSPAERAGICKGMYVYACGGKGVTATADATAYLNAAEGAATLSCGFAADGSDARDYTVTRAPYLASYCGYADSEITLGFRGEEKLVLTETGGGIAELPADTACISLMEFEGNAAAEFRILLGEMKERGRKNLILDLRGNGGGYLSVLRDIASHLLRNAEGERPLIARARYRDGTTSDYYATGNDFSAYFGADFHIYVFADENTASASEALIGALIDYGTCGYGDVFLRKGTGVAKTYGKGVMQARLVAPDGNMMMLTAAEILWPSGKCIHGTGITEADGAAAVSAPLLPGQEDEFMRAALSSIA